MRRGAAGDVFPVQSGRGDKGFLFERKKGRKGRRVRLFTSCNSSIAGSSMRESVSAGEKDRLSRGGRGGGESRYVQCLKLFLLWKRQKKEAENWER